MNVTINVQVAEVKVAEAKQKQSILSKLERRMNEGVFHDEKMKTACKRCGKAEVKVFSY